MLGAVYLAHRFVLVPRLLPHFRILLPLRPIQQRVSKGLVKVDDQTGEDLGCEVLGPGRGLGRERMRFIFFQKRDDGRVTRERDELCDDRGAAYEWTVGLMQTKAPPAPGCSS